MSISPLSHVAEHVLLGEGTTVEEFCLVGKHIGSAGDGAADGEVKTVIGPHSTLRSHTVLYAGSTIGARFQTGHHALVRECNTIGDNVSIGSLSVVEHHVILGDGVRIIRSAVPKVLGARTGADRPARHADQRALPRCPDVAKCLKGVISARRPRGRQRHDPARGADRGTGPDRGGGRGHQGCRAGHGGGGNGRSPGEVDRRAVVPGGS